MAMELKRMIEIAKSGHAVYIDDVDEAFSNGSCKIVCTDDLPTGGFRRYTINLPEIDVDNSEEYTFVENYFFAWVYNIISTFGGTIFHLNIQEGDVLAAKLCSRIDEAFCVRVEKQLRSGYGKCLNVTDRVNTALGFESFRFSVETGEAAPYMPEKKERLDVKERFLHTVETVRHGSWCGLDVGGTDIKVVGVKDGKIKAVKEFDWNPTLFTNIEQLIDPIVLMARVVAVALAVPEEASDETKRLVKQMLDKDSGLTDMDTYASQLEKEFGFDPLWGVGVSFPDVAINNLIVGGETLKTRNIRAASPDYESEFARLKSLSELIRTYCRPNANIHIANDGSLAAYTAAVEWAYTEEHCSIIQDGVFAHTLGTELGTGWIDESGDIPQIPLEVYNCVIDLGNTPAQQYALTDLRSPRNFNTGISGTLQKYTSQYGAYRIAVRRFAEQDPSAYQQLLDLGFIEEKENGIFVIQEPKDMRKPLLQYLMDLAADGHAQSEEVFREIGECLAVTRKVTERLLQPKTSIRVLFGRFVKNKRVFDLMCEGAMRRDDATYAATDSTLSYTPLMMELDADSEHTVAQFAQAVGAVYFAV